MHRASTTVALLAVLGGLAACGGSTASEEPDVTIAPRALAEALANDREGAVATYGGQHGVYSNHR